MPEDLLEQAIFTSAQTRRGDGYQLVAQSKGVSQTDARELTAWGPSHDALLFPEQGGVSFNFFALSRGAFALGRTTAEGAEYSRRGGMRIYTHFLIALPETLARFANNPVALLKAARADGVLDPKQAVETQLPGIVISGSASVVDRMSIQRTRDEIGVLQLAPILDAMLSGDNVAIAGSQAPEALFSALLSLLPPDCRTAFSFATGLKFSRRRACRLFVVPDDPATHRQIRRLGAHKLFDLKEKATSAQPLEHGWAQFVHKVLTADRVELLAEEFCKPRETLTVDTLEGIGHNLANDQQLWAGERQPERQSAGATHTRSDPRASVSENPLENPPGQAIGTLEREGVLIADLEKLGHVDDAVFAVLEGNKDSLVGLRDMWSTLRDELDPSTIAESREHYLRRALAIWREQAGAPATSTPDLATDLLDLLCVVLDD